MTSDGINTEHWATTQALAEQLANAASRNDEGLLRRLTRELLAHLKALEERYGTLPSILATRADYTENRRERIKLLVRAYDLAKRLGDRPNVTFTASSLAEVFVEETRDPVAGAQWVAALADALGDHWDDWEHEQFAAFAAKLQALQLKQSKLGPSVA